MYDCTYTYATMNIRNMAIAHISDKTPMKKTFC